MNYRVLFNSIIGLAGMSLCLTVMAGSERYSHGPSDRADEHMKLIGTVAEIHDSLMPGVLITIDSGSKKFTTTSDEFGSYEFSGIPGGVYHITTEKPGFYDLRRASFVLERGKTTKMNLVLLQQFISIALALDGSGAKYRASTLPAPKYEILYPSSPKDSALEFLVRFTTRRASRSVITYRNAELSYDALSIYADRLIVDRKTLHVRAEGNVTIDNGSQRRKFNGAEAEFSVGESQLKIAKTF
ncbi:MAG TPA: hypothetical protein DC054_19405 [Blastocatellia bacterium]|nr:hypothetical protein [Blastocatellia bacterium]